MALRYVGLRLEMVNNGAIITSAGALRPLNAAVGPGRSETSFHYSGVAFDLSTVTGMLDPNVDPFIITHDNVYWRVWARTDSGAERELDAVVWNAGNTSSQTLTVRCIDFTALAESFGFRRIRPRRTFPQDRMSAEWWHFQCEDLLVPWISQFGTELLAVYTEAELQNVQPIWRNRKKIFKRRNNGWN